MKFKLNKITIKKLPSTLLCVFIIMIVIIAILISANTILKYLSVKKDNQLLESIKANKNIEIDELKYYINTEIDDEYKERMARLLGYCFPDEIIYYIE